MVRILLCGVLALVPVLAWAQPTATPGQAFAFDFVTADLATYSVTRFEMRVDTGTWVSVAIPTVANDTQTPAGSSTYRVAIPALTPGAHSVAFRACNSGGCGTASAPLDFTLVIVPPPPSGVRVAGVGQ